MVRDQQETGINSTKLRMAKLYGILLVPSVIG